MTSCGFPTTNPECLDSELVILTKILQRLNINAAVQADLPSGNVAVTNFPANQTVTVSNPDGYPEDTPATAGETVFMAGVVRQDAAGTLVDADGDRTELQVNSAGSLRVEITSGGSGGTQYAEDTASTAGELLNMAGVVRQDVAGSLVGTDGDRTELQVNASGSLRVDGSAVAQPVTDNAGSLTVDNTGTFAIQDSQKVVDNTAFVDGTTPVQPAGFIFDEVAGTALTENDAAAARVDSKRAIVTTLEDATTRGLRATIRDLASNDALNVAIVDGAGAQVTTFGGGTEYAEDTPSTAGEMVTMMGVIRRDTPGTTVGADMDRAELQVNASGFLRVETSSRGSAVTDRSGTITTGGTSQQLAAANTFRIYLFVENVSAENLWINFGVAAVANQPSIKILPNGSFVMEGNFVTTQVVNIIGATTGSAFTAKEAP